MPDDPSAAGVPATPAAKPARESFSPVVIEVGDGSTPYDPWANFRDENGAAHIAVPYSPPPPPPPRRTASSIVERVEWEQREAERPRLAEERSRSMRDALAPLTPRFRAAADALGEALRPVFAAPYSADSTPHAEAVSEALDRVGEAIRAHDELPAIRSTAGRWRFDTGEGSAINPVEGGPSGIVERLERVDWPGVKEVMSIEASACAVVALLAATDPGELRQAVGALLRPTAMKLAIGFLPYLVRLLEPDGDGLIPIWGRGDEGRGDDWVAGSPGDHYSPLAWLAAGWHSEEMAALLRQRQTLQEEVPDADPHPEQPVGQDIEAEAAEQDAGEPSEAPAPGRPPAMPVTSAEGDSALSENKCCILDSLLREGAVERRHKVSTAKLAQLVNGPKGNPLSFKRPVAQLVMSGLVASCGGRDGGVWLTAEGCAAARRYGGRK